MHDATPSTDALIDQLAERAAPVRRLSSPLRRTALWLLVATVIIAGIMFSHGVRSGWLDAMFAPSAAIEWIASVLTGVLAAYAVFQISVPGRSAAWAWLPVPAAALWFAGLGAGCLADLARVGSAAFAFDAEASECAWAITLTSVPLGLVLLLMVRHAGVVRPGATALLTALSAAALSAAGASLFHGGESALMVLLWHVGAVAVLSTLSWAFGRQLFAWIGYARR
ncbi:MAG: NrsF family protein [Luteimonas sp.]